MKRWMLAALLTLSGTAQAHEIWIERDGSGPVRIYLGEPAETPPPGGDPEFAKLTAPRLLPAPKTAPQRRAGFLEAMLPAGDVRLVDDNVFAPWGEAGKREGVVYYARAGRRDARATLPLELAPAKADGDRFVLHRNGKPAADVEVTAIAPDRSTRKLRTDASGAVELGSAAPGRHILVAAVKDEGRTTLPGGEVAAVHRITTTSFVVR